ncbi:PP2A regulatory subunit tap46 [Castilleja foliolosa]|uniref:PP2A regulatory subunit TAP46 n=1 Tax=Castilleja foliolosa TaxID=1961234 RepID=A0ABD3EIS4_9LAMI
MVELNMEEMSLPFLFEQSRKIHQAASDSSLDQDTVRKGCEQLKKCEEMIGKLGLFSANETKDEISTTKLKYLLVPYYLGELTEKITEEDRIQVLKASQAKLKEFLSFCEVMELMPKEELESIQAMSNTSADQRAKKIARFKRQKAAESKLFEIRERKERRGRSTRAVALSTPVEAGEEDVEDDDGEEEREAWLTTISLALCKAFDLLEMLKKEEEMLSAVKERQSQGEDDELSHTALDERTKKAEAWHRNGAAWARYTKPAAPITCATFAQDVLEGRANVSQFHEHKHQPMIFGPTSLVAKNPTSEREKLAAQVFQPHHRLPTMSIEEAGLKEMEIMNKWQETNVKLMEEANSSWHKDNRLPSSQGEDDDNDDEDDDAAQDKARAWDDWKDDNPRGAGNKKLTPCG